MARYTTKLALLGNCIDYSGAFPPAALSVDEILVKAAAFRKTSRHPWLLGKIALPLSDLKAISTRSLYQYGADGSPWLFTAFGTNGAEAGDFARQVEWDLREVRHWNERGRHGSLRHQIVAYETRLPLELLVARSVDEIYPRLQLALDRMCDISEGTVDPFFEVGWEGDWRTSLRVVSHALAEWCDERHERSVIPGIKVRATGKSTPRPEELAAFVNACTALGLRFKASHGLHHAVTSTRGIGFVNLLASLTLSQVLGGESFDETETTRCLASMEVQKFRFDDEGFEWDGHRIERDAIDAARRQHGACFGSCSLDEPDEDLAQIFPSKEEGEERK